MTIEEKRKTLEEHLPNDGTRRLFFNDFEIGDMTINSIDFENGMVEYEYTVLGECGCCYEFVRDWESLDSFLESISEFELKDLVADIIL